MPWIRLDDQFPDHPKVIEAGPLASWLYVCGIGYCNRLLTDGFIPLGQVRKLADVDSAGELAARLVAVGLWDEAEGGYRIHDYLEYQPSAEEVKAERAGNARRQQEWRGRNKGSSAVSNAVTDSVSNAPNNGPVTPAPYPSRTHPVPVPLPDPVPDPPGVVRAAPKRANAQATLPSAEELIEQLRPWADKKGVRDILADEVDRFRDYCLSGKNGRPVTYADYAAGCRKWITNPSYGHTSQSRAPTALNGQRSNAAVKEERMFSNVHAWTPPERSAR